MIVPGPNLLTGIMRTIRNIVGQPEGFLLINLLFWSAIFIMTFGSRICELKLCKTIYSVCSWQAIGGLLCHVMGIVPRIMIFVYLVACNGSVKKLNHYVLDPWQRIVCFIKDVINRIHTNLCSVDLGKKEAAE